MPSYATRCLQARCASLGFWPGPIDGVDGPRTRAAITAATASQRARGLPLVHPSGITRLHLHWTAGRWNPSALDRQHYHIVIDGDGNVIRCNPDTAKLAHTLNANGAAIALAVCGMVGAVERPFDHGPEPITDKQVQAMAAAAAAMCRTYDLPVSRWSVLMHSEVQPTLGITQRGKWDLNWLPGMAGPTDPLTAGDKLRAAVARYL